MDKIIIKGGKKLTGEIRVSGAKNAALPAIAAAILTTEELELSNLPAVKDVDSTLQLLAHMGAEVEKAKTGRRAVVRCIKLGNPEAPYDLVRKIARLPASF